MIVLDASAVIALLTDEPAADEVSDLLGRHESRCSAVNLAEVADGLVRVGRVSSEAVDQALSDLIEAGMRVVSGDQAVALRAGTIRAAHYSRRDAAVSLADCFAIATAESTGGTLLTSDRDLCRLAERLAIAVHPLPNSAGVRATLRGPVGET